MKKVLIFLIGFICLKGTYGQTKTRVGIDQVVLDEMIKQELIGVAVGIVENGRITHLKGYGYSDRERKTRMTTTTPIRWASISKVLTAVATYQLIQKGKLKENGKVSEYLFADVWPQNGDKKNITLLNLLQHRSGINHYGNGKGSNRQGRYDSSLKPYGTLSTIWDAKRSVAMFKDAPLDFRPGTDFLYTTYGYNLLGAVIDKVSPGGYQQYIYNNIKRPLGMTTLAPSLNRWKGYAKNCNGVVMERMDNSKMSVLPGGGWISNIEDATKLMKGLIDGKLLRFMPLLKGHSDNENGYRSGMQQLRRCGRTILGHGGSHKNLRTAMYYFNGEQDGIVIMSNGEHTNRWQLFDRIAGKIGKGCRAATNYANANCGLGSCDRKFIGVWRETGKKKIIRRDLSTNDFNTEWNYLKKFGYQVFDIEVYVKNGKLLWGGIFKKTKETGFAMWRNFDQKNFDAKWRDMSSKGYRLYDVETYMVGGKRKWAGLFKKGTGKYALYSNYSTSNFGRKRDELAKLGYKLIDIEVYDTRDGLKWTGVWTQGKDGLLNRNYNYSKFSGLVNDRSKKGYQLIDIERYTSKGIEKWAGIWEKSSEGQRYLMNSKYCHLTEFDDLKSKESYELIDLENY